MTDRPSCVCHDAPMWRAGGGRWSCSVRERARNARRVRMGAGGMNLFAGRTPTAEQTHLLRTRIKEAPNGTVRNP